MRTPAMLAVTRAAREGVMRTHSLESSSGQASRALILIASLTGTFGAEESLAASSVYLGSQATICPSGRYSDLLSVTVPLSPENGDTLYLFARTTARRSYTGSHTANLLDAM